MKEVFRDVVILFIVLSWIIFIWFSKGLIFAGGEEGIPFYDLNKTTQFVSYSWQDVSGGYPTQLLLNRMPYFNFLKAIYSLGFEGYLVQALHFFILMFIGCIAFYFLLKETVGQELDLKQNHLLGLVPLIGSFFYLLNPFSMTQIWGRGLYLQFFPFALIPSFLLMFVLGLRYKNIIFGYLGLLLSVFLAGAFGNPSYVFSLWVVVLIYLLFYIYKNRNPKAILFSTLFFLFMLIGWIVVNMWWIYPFINISTNQYAIALANNVENVDTLKGISRDYKLHSLIRLIHEGYFYRGEKYGTSYLSVTFMLISWLTPLMLLFSYRVFKKLKSFLFFGTLFLFSLFICLGANFPSGWLFIFLFEKLPFLQALRNPFEKFGVVLTLSYAPFFAIGLLTVSALVGRLFKKTNASILTLFVLLFLIFGIFLWPIWTGQFAGGLVFNPWVKVPDYYKSLNNWLDEQKDEGRIIHLPINHGDGLRYNGWEHSYQGIEPGEYIYDRPSIGKYGQPFKSYYKFLLDRFDKFVPLTFGPDPDFSSSEFKSEQFYQELAKLNVRYIILHYDIDPILGNFGEPGVVADYLKEQKNINKVSSIGKLDIYKINYPEDIKLIYSSNAKVFYYKNNPTLYSIDFIDVENPFELYFLENFDPNWELLIGGEKVQSHSTVFSYANKWKVGKTGSYKGIIKYKPQDFVNEGIGITKKALLAIGVFSLSYTLVYFIWKQRKI